MARTPAQRGPIGNWLVESRIARAWDTQERARAEIERLTGWRIPQSVYAEWESGRRVPSDGNLTKLREFYGTKETGATLSGDAGLAAAIDRQTEALLTAIRDRDSTLARRDQEIEALLRELGEYRKEAARARIVEQSLIEALPAAIATALVAALGATREADPVAEPPAPVRPGVAER